MCTGSRGLISRTNCLAICSVIAGLLLALPASTFAGEPGDWQESGRVHASDQSYYFGRSADVSADVVVVGTFEGAAYIYERNYGGSDNWGHVAQRYPQGSSGTYFGHDVAVSGDMVVVGAWGEEAVYVFERDQGGEQNWGQVARLKASDGAAGHNFGSSVDASGGVIVVGAPNHSQNGVPAGAAYVFERARDGSQHWSQTQRLIVDDGIAGDHFGEAVAVSGDAMVIGASGRDDAGDNAGGAFVFERAPGAASNWIQVAHLTPMSRNEQDDFGSSVAIDGDLIVVGAHGYDADDEDVGAVFAFKRERNTGRWREALRLSPFELVEGDRFGASVELDGTTLVVGAPHQDRSKADVGAVYVFSFSSEPPFNARLDGKLTAENPAEHARFGLPVAVSGDTVVVGSIRSSSAYIFARQGGLVAQRDEADTDVGESVEIPVLANDELPSDAEPTVVISLAPVLGKVAVNEDGVVTYAPDDGVHGKDTFQYRVITADGSSDLATIAVRVGEPWVDEPTEDPSTASEGCGCASASDRIPVGDGLLVLLVAAAFLARRRHNNRG